MPCRVAPLAVKVAVRGARRRCFDFQRRSSFGCFPAASSLARYNPCPGSSRFSLRRFIGHWKRPPTSSHRMLLNDPILMAFEHPRNGAAAPKQTTSKTAIPWLSFVHLTMPFPLLKSTHCSTGIASLDGLIGCQTRSAPRAVGDLLLCPARSLALGQN